MLFEVTTKVKNTCNEAASELSITIRSSTAGAAQVILDKVFHFTSVDIKPDMAIAVYATDDRHRLVFSRVTEDSITGLLHVDTLAERLTEADYEHWIIHKHLGRYIFIAEGAFMFILDKETAFANIAAIKSVDRKLATFASSTDPTRAEITTTALCGMPCQLVKRTLGVIEIESRGSEVLVTSYYYKPVPGKPLLHPEFDYVTERSDTITDFYGVNDKGTFVVRFTEED